MIALPVLVGGNCHLNNDANVISNDVSNSRDSSHLTTSIPSCVELSLDNRPIASREDSIVCSIIVNNPVNIASGHPTLDEIDESISQMKTLIKILKSVPTYMFNKGVSPGFETVASSDPRWVKKKEFDLYETLPSVNLHDDLGPFIPVPSPAATIHYFTTIMDTWVDRRRCLLNMGGQQMKNWKDYSFCSCISAWSHLKGDLLWQLANQTFEQNMIREASMATTFHLRDNPKAWNRLYAEEFCPSPIAAKEMYKENTKVQLILRREEYLDTFISLALQAKHRIDISTCYLFNHCPAQKYILLDLLPYIARVRGVKIRVLCDMKPIESRILMSALCPKTSGVVDKAAKDFNQEWDFANRLPKDAPPVSQEVEKDISALDFITKVLDTAHSMPDGSYDFSWWCARDAKSHYRIKTHVKCAVFDGSRDSKGMSRGMALLGGSNLCPKAGDSDVDILVAGEEIVDQIGETFEWLWDYMREDDAVDLQPVVIDSTDEQKKEESEVSQSTDIFPQQLWTDECPVAYVRCEASSVGNTDYIFRHVLGGIASAQESIIMCMGHMNVPEPLAEQLAKAVQRGVRVQLLVNSIASCDLRVNQSDLFNSLKSLLNIAPEVEVWSTAFPSDRYRVSESVHGEIGAPIPEHAPALHAKYTVVDGKWCALGSWNFWTRCAFYEIEHDLLIESEAVAQHLLEKFEKEKEKWCIRLESTWQWNLYCPKGCYLCAPFGPFYR